MKRNYVLLATALLVLSGYSAAATSYQPSATDAQAQVIVTGGDFTDREIRGEVMRRIDEKLVLGTQNISVQSFNHDVYLYGTADTRMESEEAEAIARTVPGVRKVYNGLGSLGV